MIQSVYRSVLCAGAVGVLLSGCIIANVPGDETEPEGDPPVCGLDDERDADGDCIADTADNCAAIGNPEQLDADADDLGDACDLLVVTPVGNLTVNTWAGTTSHTIASLDNNTDAPLAWSLSPVAIELAEARGFDPARIALDAVEGVVESGERFDLVPRFDTQGLDPGLYHAAFSLETNGDTRVIELDVHVVPQDVDEAYCVYDIRMTQIYVDRGQGAAEGELELRIVADMGDQVLVYPAATMWLTLGEDHEVDPNAAVGEMVVDDAQSDTVEIGLTALDIDAEGEDRAFRPIELTLGCEAGIGETVIRTAVVELDSASGASGLVAVTLEAQPRIGG